MNYKNYLFHPSSLSFVLDSYIKEYYSPALTLKEQEDYEELTKKGSSSKKLATLQAKIDKKNNKGGIELTEATKTKLLEIWLKESAQVSNFSGNEYTRVGNDYEQASIDLVNKVFSRNFQKNEKTYKNDWFVGTPDIVEWESVLDIKTKSRFDLFLRAGQKEADSFFWQLYGYKKLTGAKRVFIIFCLPSRTDEDILLEQERETRYIKNLEKTKKAKKQVYLNMNFDRFPELSRIKFFEVKSLKLKDGSELNMDDIDDSVVELYLRRCRQYLQGIEDKNRNFFKNDKKND